MMRGKKFSPDSSENASLNAVTTGTGKAIATNDLRQITWNAIYSVAPTVGTLVVEHAPTRDYAGTWQELDSIDCSALSAGTAGSGTYPGLLSFVRGRFSADADQAVTLYINGLLG